MLEFKIRNKCFTFSDVSSPGSRSKSGRILMRSCRLEEEDLQMIDQDEGLQPSNTCPEDLGGAG
jgi:hypothetical protein